MTSSTFRPYQYPYLFQFHNVLGELSKLGEQGHERLAIVPKEHGYTLQTKAKPLSLWGRLWVWLFGPEDTVKYVKVSQFAEAFFQENLPLMRDNTPRDNLAVLPTLLKIQARFPQVAGLQPAITQILAHINQTFTVADDIRRREKQILKEAERGAKKTVTDALNTTRDEIAALEEEKASLERRNAGIQRLMTLPPQTEERLRELVKNTTFLDTVFICQNGDEVYAHSLFLQDIHFCSTDVRGHFQEVKKEQHLCKDGKTRTPIDLRTSSPVGKKHRKEVVECMVEWSRSFQFYPMDDAFAIEILELTDELGFHALKQACQKQMIKQTKDLNQALHWVRYPQFPEIFHHSIDVIAQHLPDVHENLFLQFSPETVMGLLKSDQVRIESEYELYELLKKWAKHNQIKNLADYLSHIRFEYFPPKKLKHKPKELALQSRPCRRYFEIGEGFKLVSPGNWVLRITLDQILAFCFQTNRTIRSSHISFNSEGLQLPPDLAYTWTVNSKFVTKSNPTHIEHGLEFITLVLMELRKKEYTWSKEEIEDFLKGRELTLYLKVTLEKL